jgi:hypothetical protein
VIYALLASACAPDPDPVGRLPQHPTPGDVLLEAPLDRDGDGFADDVDCGPGDPAIYPGAPERCNGLDDDCDGSPDPDADQDLDGDGVPWCLDCNNQDPTFRPGAEDPLGDGLDQDCDGTDGAGLQLPSPASVGADVGALYGFSLASGDFDGDGCSDLVVGQPSDPSNDVTEEDLVALLTGCTADAPVTINHRAGLFGYSVAVGPATIAVLQPWYRLNAGRIHVFDSTFGPEAEPRLDIIGGYGQYGVHGMALLGDPSEWVQFAALRPEDRQLRFNLVSASRTGEVHLSYDLPDLSIATDSYTPLGANQAANVGDRDGDGSVDLALPVTIAEEAVYFFGEVGPGHTRDAPEVWRDEPDSYAGWFMGGGADLDGDGLDDALIGSALADGTAPTAGRVYLTPWLGPGDRWLEAEAPARVEGETPYDYTGEATAIGDLDGDGQNDLVVGAPGDFSRDVAHGKVMVFLGPLAGVYDRYDADLVFVGEAPGDHVGAAVALGDFDGSGRLDLAIGAPFADGVEENTGQVYILDDPL